MSQGDERKLREELEQILTNIDEQSRSLASEARPIVESAERISEKARAFKELLVSMPIGKIPSNELRELTGHWSGLADSTLEMRFQIRESHPTFQAAVSSTSYGTSTAAYAWVQGESLNLDSRAQTAARNYQLIARRGNSLQAVCSQLEKFGLNEVSKGATSPSNQLVTANRAIGAALSGDGTQTAVAIPLREAIDLVVSEVYRRCPGQEKASNRSEKVVSIGQRAGLPGLAAPHFQRLGDDLRRLHDELSGAKNRTRSEADLRFMFHRGLEYLKALLDSVDNSKLRR